MNRGIAKRPLFEDRACMRQFLAYLALAVRRGEIEAHCFCLLPTHFHLLVRSPKGQLATAMQRVLNSYSRWFNRRRRRDGTLYRARYNSKLVGSMTYRRVLVSYIDHNPVGAGLVDDPADYPFGSAQCWAKRRFPPWLSVDWILEELGAAHGSPLVARSDQSTLSTWYRQAFGAMPNPDLLEVVGSRVRRNKFNGDVLDDLVGGAPDKVRAWMIRKTHLADGMIPGQPVTGTVSIAHVLRDAHARRPTWSVSIGQRSIDAWLLIEVMMLRDLCSLSFPEIGRRMGCTNVTARNYYLKHRHVFERDASYRSMSIQTASAALRLCHGER